MRDTVRPLTPLVVETAPMCFRMVNSVRDAAEMLVKGWPEEGRGPAYRAALQACHDALAGSAKPAVARAAFMAAAREAGIIVRDQ